MTLARSLRAHARQIATSDPMQAAALRWHANQLEPTHRARRAR